MWTFFEAKALDTAASANSILSLVKKWGRTQTLDISAFAESLEYFKNRFVSNGAFTYKFERLNLRKNDKPDLVKAVLKGETTDPTSSLAALLIIIYRLRNNLFHGVKWAYNFEDQLSNFTHANYVLMILLERHVRL